MKQISLLVCTLMLCSYAMAEACDSAITQKEINQCYDNEYKKQDEQLNITYKTVLAHASNQQQDQLKIAQHYWIAFRDADCRFLSYGSEQGSIWPMVHTLCLTDKTRERIEQLKSTLQCQEGDTGCLFQPN